MPKKLSHVKQLQKDCNELWKECVSLRDGPGCKVKEIYPEIALAHSGPLQADHCFTRSNKHLFFDIANGTVVCSSCNMAKHYDNKSVKRAVDEIVKAREGATKWNEMLECDMKMGPNHNWNKLWWLQEIKEELEDALKQSKRQRSKHLVNDGSRNKKRKQRAEEVSLGELFDKAE